MVPTLTDLGIDERIQEQLRESFKQSITGDLFFFYGDSFERFTREYQHIVPSTQKIWIGCAEPVGIVEQAIVGYSAMEAISFLELNKHRFPKLDSVVLVATGYQPSFDQAQSIRKVFSNSKITTIFGNDLFGSLADIVLATGIHRVPVALALDKNETVTISFRSSKFKFAQHHLSLNSLEQKVNMRFNVRTRKPACCFSFLEELICRSL